MTIQYNSSWLLVVLTAVVALKLCLSAPLDLDNNQNNNINNNKIHSDTNLRIKRALFNNPESRLAPGFGKRSRQQFLWKRFFQGASNRMGMMFGKRDQGFPDGSEEELPALDFRGALQDSGFDSHEIDSDFDFRAAVDSLLKRLRQDPDLEMALFSQYFGDAGVNPEVTEGQY